MNSICISTLLKRLILENKQDIIYHYKLAPIHTFEFLSPSIEKVSGHSLKEWYINPHFCLQIIHPDDRHELMKLFERTSETFGPIVLRSLHQQTGIMSWTEHWGIIEYHSPKNPKAIAGIGRDISKQMDIAHERARLIGEERSARLKLETVIQKKTDFFEALVHDLRTPLTTLLLRISLLLNHLRNHPLNLTQATFTQPSLTHQMMESMLENVQLSAERIKQLINDLVELIKYSENKVHLDNGRTTYRAELILNRSTERILPLAQRKGIDIRVHSNDPTLQIHVNAREISRALEILLKNAILSKTDSKAIHLDLKHEGPYAIFSVGDSGPSDHIGLAITKQIVEAHGGQLWTEKVSAGGNTLHFKVPC